MITKIRKIFFDYEREEEWLNRMADNGLAFVNYSLFTYTFVDGKPGEYLYRIEFLKNHPSHNESAGYFEFLKETGIEVISTWFKWVYFRKKKSEGLFDLYSDFESKSAHYKRILNIYNFGGWLNIIIGFINLSIFIVEALFSSGELPTINLLCSLINIGVGSLLIKLAVRLDKKIKKLEDAKNLSEY